LPIDPTAAWHVDLVSNGNEEDTRLYLTHYALEDWRRQWLADFPDHDMPVHEPLPYHQCLSEILTRGGSGHFAPKTLAPQAGKTSLRRLVGDDRGAPLRHPTGISAPPGRFFCRTRARPAQTVLFAKRLNPLVVGRRNFRKALALRPRSAAATPSRCLTIDSWTLNKP
jgi:hypothetical protein